MVKLILNSIEEKFAKAIWHEKISHDELNDIEKEVKNYNIMNTNILNEHNNGWKPTVLTDDLKKKLMEKGKVSEKTDVWNSLRKDHKI